MQSVFTRLIHRLRRILYRVGHFITSLTPARPLRFWCTMDSCMDCDNDIIVVGDGAAIHEFDKNGSVSSQQQQDMNHDGRVGRTCDEITDVDNKHMMISDSPSTSCGEWYQQNSLMTPLLREDLHRHERFAAADTCQKQQRFVILDIDETIVSTKNSHRHPRYDHFTITFEYPTASAAAVVVLDSGSHDSKNNNDNTMASAPLASNTSYVTYTVHIRPHTISFLKCCLEHDIELVVFSAGQYKYVHAVCDELFGRILGRRPCKVFTYDDMHTDPITLRRSKKLDNILAHLDTHRQHVWVLDDASYNYLDSHDDERVLRIPAWDVDRLPMTQQQQNQNDPCLSSVMPITPVSCHHDDNWLWWAWLRMAHDWKLTTPSQYAHHIPTHASIDDVLFAWDIMSLGILHQQQQQQYPQMVTRSSSASTTIKPKRATFQQQQQSQRRWQPPSLLDATYDDAFATNNTRSSTTTMDDWSYYYGMANNVYSQPFASISSITDYLSAQQPDKTVFTRENILPMGITSQAISVPNTVAGMDDAGDDDEEEDAVDEDDNMQMNEEEDDDEDSLTDDDAIHEMMTSTGNHRTTDNIHISVCPIEWKDVDDLWSSAARGLVTENTMSSVDSMDEESSSSSSSSSFVEFTRPQTEDHMTCDDGCDSLAQSVSSIHVEKDAVPKIEPTTPVLPYINIHHAT